MVQALYQVGDHWFLGLRYQNVHLKSAMDLSQLPGIGAIIPEADLRRTTASLGPAVEYDSRDDSFYPTTGTYAKANLNFYTSAFGSDVNFRQFSASWNRYWPYSPGTVVAARVATCVVGGNVPFSDLCMYGRNNDLRGYSTGQYRDKAMLAAQAEMRWTLGHRWGAVAFGGIGSIGPSFSELLQQKMLPSIGAGLRWQASKDYKMNVSLDVAFTKDDRAVYLYVGEAF
jgi:outer membrane protein assembly factor BamA